MAVALDFQPETSESELDFQPDQTRPPFGRLEAVLPPRRLTVQDILQGGARTILRSEPRGTPLGALKGLIELGLVPARAGLEKLREPQRPFSELLRSKFGEAVHPGAVERDPLEQAIEGVGAGELAFRGAGAVGAGLGLGLALTRGPRLATQVARTPLRSTVPPVLERLGGEAGQQLAGPQGITKLIRGERATLAQQAGEESTRIITRRFQSRFQELTQQQTRALDEVRARSTATLRRLGEAEQRELATLTQQQRGLEEGLNQLGLEKVKAIRSQFPSVAVKSSTTYRRLVNRGLQRAGHRPIGREEFADELASLLPDDSSYVSTLVERLFPAREGEAAIEAISARAAHEEILGLRQGIKLPAKRSTRAFTQNELRQDRAVKALTNILTRRGLKEFRTADAHWAQWAPLRDRVFKDFQPFMKDPLELDAMTGRLLKSVQERTPRFAERIEEELGVPLLPEFRQVLNQLDEVKQTQVAVGLKSAMLREQAQFTGQRAEAGIAELFGTRRQQLQAAKQLDLDFIQQNLNRLMGDIRFKQWVARGTVGFAGMLVVWNLISNLLQPLFRQQGGRFENF